MFRVVRGSAVWLFVGWEEKTGRGVEGGKGVKRWGELDALVGSLPGVVGFVS